MNIAKASASSGIMSPRTRTSSTPCSPCSSSKKRSRSSTKRRHKNWMIPYSIVRFTLWPFSTQIRRLWRNSNSGSRASLRLSTCGFRSLPIPRPIAGHLGKAHELTKQSLDSAIRADSKESGAIWQENAALREAAFGNAPEARQAAAEGLKLAPTSQGVQVEAALAFAMAGDAARAESLAQDLNKRFPLDTQMQSLWLPAIRAELALDRKNPAEALNSLQAAAPPIELGQIAFVANSSCLYPTYIRGRSLPGSGTGQRSRRRVPEDSRPQRHRLELLDGSIGASRRGSCERFAVENFARRGCRCRPRPGTRRLQRFPHPLERRRS